MKVSDLKIKPFEMECCKNDCKNKDIKKCVTPLCTTLAIVNGLIEIDAHFIQSRCESTMPQPTIGEVQ